MSTDKIYVYHHNDHDGIVAAGILYKRYKNPVNKHKIIFNMIDYNVLLNFDHIDFEKGDKVFFLDYSFSNKDNIEEFKKLLNRRIHDNDVVWIDHHKTSVGGELNTLYRIPGVRRMGLCGAAWTYLYFFYFEEIGLTDLESRDDLPELFHKNEYIPIFLKYIDDYDCWKHLYPATNNFHYGLTISHPTDDIIELLLCKTVELKSMVSKYITDIIKQGEAVQKFLEFENKEYHVDMYGFEYTLPEEHGGYKCFCLNRKGNSIMFGDKVNEYDAVIPFYYDGSRWTYSMFTIKDNVDCEKVAKSFGGGGHLKAAGWTSDKLMF